MKESGSMPRGVMHYAEGNRNSLCGAGNQGQWDDSHQRGNPSGHQNDRIISPKNSTRTSVPHTRDSCDKYSHHV
jgi:hypothetical protein